MVAEAREGMIPLARPAIAEAEIHAVERVMRSGRLVMGPENQRFEAALATLCGREHAVCVTSGTTALELCLWALWQSDTVASKPHGGQAGDVSGLSGAPGPREVLVPAAGFPAAANAVLRLGLCPVAVDVAADSWTLDVAAAERAITPATWAVIAVDMFGQVAEVEPLRALCDRAGLHLVDDAACSLGALDSRGHGGGSYGIAATLSFHPRKVITTGEGGAVVCDDSRVAEILRQLRNQGQDGPGRFVRAGSNARLPEVAAAMGLVQLERLDAMLRERALLVDGYRERLDALCQAGALSWQVWPDEARPAHQTFAILLGPRASGHGARERVRQGLIERGIECTVAAYSLHRLEAYAKLPGIAGKDAAVANALHDRGLALPLFVGMRSAELDRVADALTEVLHDGGFA